METVGSMGHKTLQPLSPSLSWTIPAAWVLHPVTQKMADEVETSF